jgi:hypothetical protein
VQRTLELVIVGDLSLTQRPAGVGAFVVDGVESALDIDQGDLDAGDVDDGRLAGREILDFAHIDEIGHAMFPFSG